MTREKLIELLKNLVAAGSLAKPLLATLDGVLPKPVYVVADWVLDHSDCLTELLERLAAEVFSAQDPTTDPLAEVVGAIGECRDCCPKAA